MRKSRRKKQGGQHEEMQEEKQEVKQEEKQEEKQMKKLDSANRREAVWDISKTAS